MIYILRAIVIITGIIVVAGGCKKSAQPETITTDSVPIVKATEILSLQPEKYLQLPGELHPWNRVNIYSKVKGFVKEVKVDRGSIVKKGQILTMLDAPEVMAELTQAEGQLRASEALFHESQARYNASKLTYQRLLKASQTQGAVALNELDQAKANMLADSAATANAEGGVKAAQAYYRSKTEIANYLVIKAPFDGVIIERAISPGTFIGAGEATNKPLFVLEDNNILRLTVAIPESYSNAIRKDSTPVYFKVNAIVDKHFKAVFGRSAESILEKTRVMMAEFDIDNCKKELKPGMYAEVKIPVKRESTTLFIPQSAVVSSSEKVFVIKAIENRAQWIDVKKGMSIDTLIEVYGDLQAGDLVVKEASEEIREGQALNLKK